MIHDLYSTAKDSKRQASHSGPAEALAITRTPRDAAHVIAALFPKAGLIVLEEAHAFDPLGRLPGVELRNDQTNRTAMFRWNRLAIMSPGEKRVFVQEVLDGHVCGPPIIVSQC